MFSNYHLLMTSQAFVKEQVLTTLTSQQKKIAAIAALVLSCLAAIWFLGKCYFKAKETGGDQLDDAGRKADGLATENLRQNREAKTESNEIEPPKGKNSGRQDESKSDQQLEHPRKEDADLTPNALDLVKVTPGEKEKSPATLRSERREEVLEDPSATKVEPAPTISNPEQEVKPGIDVDEPENEPVDAIARDPNTRNIMIVGRSRSGKTTVRNVLENLCHVTPPGTLFYSTKEPELHRSELSGYRFNLLDTPGLCEYARTNEKARSNAEIVQLIKDKAQEHFGGKGFDNVDTVIMTFTVQQGINSADIDSLNALLPKLSLSAKKILLITHAEGYDQKGQDNVRKDLARHPVMSNLIDTYFRGKENVLFSGALDDVDVSDEILAKGKLKQIRRDRERLIKELLPKEGKQLRTARAEQIKAQVTAFFDALFPKKGEAEKKEAKTELTEDSSKVEETAAVEPVQNQETIQQDSKESASSDEKI